MCLLSAARRRAAGGWWKLTVWPSLFKKFIKKGTRRPALFFCGNLRAGGSRLDAIGDENAALPALVLNHFKKTDKEATCAR